MDSNVVDTNTDPTLNSIQVALVGLKNLKTSHTWRLEFDVYETDTAKLKELFDKIDESFYMFLVPINQQPVDKQE